MSLAASFASAASWFVGDGEAGEEEGAGACAS